MQAEAAHSHTFKQTNIHIIQTFYSGHLEISLCFVAEMSQSSNLLGLIGTKIAVSNSFQFEVILTVPHSTALHPNS